MPVRIALACFALLVVTIALLHFLRPDLDPVRHRLSEYALGRYGYLMNACFAFATLGLTALSVALFRAIARSSWLTIGCVALLAAATTNALMAIFGAETYADGQMISAIRGSVGWTHDRLALTHAFSWSIAIVAIPLGLRADATWRDFVPFSALAMMVVASAMAVRLFTSASTIGMTQRSWIAGVLFWSVWHAVEVLRRERRRATP